MTHASKTHHYHADVVWTGNTGQGTANCRAYQRSHDSSAPNKPPIPGSSDPAFRGDATRYNPEELLVMSVSSCHMLWYLHLCAEAGVVVQRYVDRAEGVMIQTADGGGRFESITLRPEIAIAPESDLALAHTLHDRAHHLCFIANSVNFPVHCRPEIARSRQGVDSSSSQP